MMNVAVYSSGGASKGFNQWSTPGAFSDSVCKGIKRRSSRDRALHMCHICVAYLCIVYVLPFFAKLWNFPAVLCHLAAVEEERESTSEGEPHNKCLLEVTFGNTIQLVVTLRCCCLIGSRIAKAGDKI